MRMATDNPASSATDSLKRSCEWNCSSGSRSPVSNGHKVQTHDSGQLFLPDVRADKFCRGQNFGGGAVENVQRTATDGAGGLLGKLHGFAENIGPVAARRHEHARFQIGFHQGLRSGHLRLGHMVKKYFELRAFANSSSCNGV